MLPPSVAEATPTDSSLAQADDHNSDMENNESRGQRAANKRTYDSDDKEDPATQAASEDLKHTTISDKEPAEGTENTTMSEADPPSHEKEDEESARQKTPEPTEPSDAQDEEMKERISSPKKKRGREQDDEVRDLEAAGNVEEVGSASNGSAINSGRAASSAPVKKRHRDTSADTITASEVGPSAKVDTALQEPTDSIKTTTSDPKPSTTSPETSSKPVVGRNLKEQPQTSPSAFASSGFGSLAASNTSGFATLATSKPSIFGAGPKTQVSGFGALATPTTGKTDTASIMSGLGSLSAESTGTTLNSGFGGAPKTGFGALGSGFGSTGFGGFASGTGPKLSSFAAAGTPAILGAEKPAKAFGAPESDEDEETDDDESRGGAASDDDESVSVEEKKKTRLSRVHVNDGEEGETTLLSFRAKLYTLVSKEKGWKERGMGTIKLNVLSSCVDYDENNQAILGSFDPSARNDSDEEGSKPALPAARLIMRQENTHRVILNTVILKALKFEEKSSNSAIQILFTAFEDTKPVNMLLKMSETNAKIFTSEIASIQYEL